MLLLLSLVLLWLSIIPAFENNLSTGAELDGMENNSKASFFNGDSLADGCVPSGHNLHFARHSDALDGFNGKWKNSSYFTVTAMLSDFINRSGCGLL